MKKVLAIGEILLEMAEVQNSLYQIGFAGDTFNFAFYLSKVSLGRTHVDYLTAVGTDTVSDQCLDYIRNMNIGIERCQRDQQRTIGLYILRNDDSGEKQYQYWRSTSAARKLFDLKQDLTGYDLVFFSGITAAISENRKSLAASIESAHDGGGAVAYDFNYRQQLWSTDSAVLFAEQILPCCNTIKMSDEDLLFLYPGESIKRLSQKHPHAEWVYTCGSEKAEVWQRGECLSVLRFNKIDKIVDSTAAGDSFFASYIDAAMSNLPLQQRLARAHFVAAQVVGQKGAIVAVEVPSDD